MLRIVKLRMSGKGMEENIMVVLWQAPSPGLPAVYDRMEGSSVIPSLLGYNPRNLPYTIETI